MNGSAAYKEIERLQTIIEENTVAAKAAVLAAAKQTAKYIAKNMLQNGLAIDSINKMTQLSIEEIEILKSELDKETSTSSAVHTTQ